MKVTLVTPVYNGMPWLPECVESVASQGHDVPLEHLVFDAGSTDGSREWLREHSSLGFTAVFEPDEGQTDALIKGLERATGEILGWLNADDLLEPGALKLAVAAFEADPGLAFVNGACLLIDRTDAVIGALPALRNQTADGLLRLAAFPPQPSTFFSASAYRQSGGLDRRYDLAMDLDLWLKLSRVGGIRSLPNDVLSRFRMHPDAKSERESGRSARQALRLRRGYGTPLRSQAAFALIRTGYIKPVTGKWMRPIRGFARWALTGRRTGTDARP